MIRINSNEDCCGCGACVSRCPKNCISMQNDEQGFLYPIVDLNSCIDCHLCEKICPMMHHDTKPTQPLATFAYSSIDHDTLMQSASGGAFSALAGYILNQNGVVFGVKFDQSWGAMHIHIEHPSDLPLLHGSKYTQSVIGTSYQSAESFLKGNRKVLFTGTPCQIAGLYKFLKDPYPGQLFTVEIICHGVPSPLIWKEMLRHTLSKHNASTDDLNSINMRDKKTGWLGYSTLLKYVSSEESNNREIRKSHAEDTFMRGFISNLYIRPSCFNCPFKAGKSHADITIGDYWGIDTSNPKLYNHDGVSVILARTQQGLSLCHHAKTAVNPTYYHDALKGNPAIEHCVEKPSLYNFFWRNYFQNGISAVEKTLRRTEPSKIRLLLRKIKNSVFGTIKR